MTRTLTLNASPLRVTICYLRFICVWIAFNGVLFVDSMHLLHGWFHSFGISSGSDIAEYIQSSLQGGIC